VTWAKTTAPALELLALGRVFLFRVSHQSHFDADLIPNRVINGDTQNLPLARLVFNPVLGRSVSEMLQRAVRACGQGQWADAEQWCVSAANVKKLPAVYRGTINIELADAVVQYYLGAVLVGKGEIETAIADMTDCAEQLAFTMPDVSAIFWLALAHIHLFQNDLPNALWALQKSYGLSQDSRTGTRDVLRPLLESEFAKIGVS
jgi:hypothetical protein